MIFSGFPGFVRGFQFFLRAQVAKERSEPRWLPMASEHRFRAHRCRLGTPVSSVQVFPEPSAQVAPECLGTAVSVTVLRRTWEHYFESPEAPSTPAQCFPVPK